MKMESQEVMMDHPSVAEQDRPRERPVTLVAGNGARPRTLLPALLTSGLLWACYFPLAWSWLAWVALVPLLCLVRTAARPRRVYLYAWVSGLAFFWPVLQWLRVADYRMYATWAALATYCSLYFPAAIFLVRQLDRHTRLPLIVTLPAVWTGLEFFRSFILTGFAWYYLAHTQHDFVTLIQVADLAGTYAVTFLLAAVNGLIFEILCGRSWFRTFFGLPAEAARAGRPALQFQIGAVLLLLGVSLAYGRWCLHQEEFTPGPRVALIQGNVDQEIRNEASAQRDKCDEMRRHYYNICDQTLSQQRPPVLLVWPETSFPEPWEEVSPGLPTPYCQGMARYVAARWRANVLLGLNAFDQGIAPDLLGAATLGASATPAFPGGIPWADLFLCGQNGDGKLRTYCSAVLIRSDGQCGGRYDKFHRVPFAEYVPFQDWLPWLAAFAPYDDYDYSIHTGRRLTRFSLANYHFGVLICLDADPFLARQYVSDAKGEPKVDFLLNIANDGWFRGTSEHEEHLAICRFRAIESRRSLARAANMGISAVIDGSGRVLQPRILPDQNEVRIWEVPQGDPVELPVSQWKQFKKVPGVLLAYIPIDERTSLYARWGDWLPWGCWLLVGGSLVVAVGRRFFLEKSSC